MASWRERARSPYAHPVRHGTIGVDGDDYDRKCGNSVTRNLSALALVAGLLAMLRSWMRTVAEAGVTSALGLMPARLRLLVVDRAPFTARLDYPEREIYLNVNSEF